MILTARVIPESGGNGNFIISLAADGRSVGSLVVHSRDYADKGEEIANRLVKLLDGKELP